MPPERGPRAGLGTTLAGCLCPVEMPGALVQVQGPWDPTVSSLGQVTQDAGVTGQWLDRLETSGGEEGFWGKVHLQETHLRLTGHHPDLKDSDLTRSTIYTDDTSGKNYKTF